MSKVKFELDRKGVRVNASVHAETYEARKKNADENTLLKALR